MINKTTNFSKLFNINISFFNKSIFKLIVLGYFVSIILLGIEVSYKGNRIFDATAKSP
jgi:hypothetical protein